jgi:hypothetical protein
MRTNYVLIDFENVQPESLAVLNSEQFNVKVFVGATQKNVTIKFAKALQSMGDRAEYIEISGTGKNALDFHIAFYIGQLAAKDETAYFHIISEDKGFDPLIKHLKENNIFAAREMSINEIPLVKSLSAKTPEKRLQLVLEKLASCKTKNPSTIKTLTSHIKAMFPIPITDEEIDKIISDLERLNHITITDKKISYSI